MAGRRPLQGRSARLPRHCDRTNIAIIGVAADPGSPGEERRGPPGRLAHPAAIASSGYGSFRL